MSSITDLWQALRFAREDLKSGLPETRGFLYFQRVKRQRRYNVPSEPQFDAAGLAFFSQAIVASSTYLEYGSGGSTVLAARHVDHLISVDNDEDFLACVARKLDGSPATRKLIYANTGIIREYGEPLLKAPTRRRLRRWRNYALAPWVYMESAGVQPDLILIDGRFRVACALMSFLRLRGDATPILFDDYVDRRDRYALVEEFSEILAFHGRLAVLRRRRDFDPAACTAAFERMIRDVP